MRLVLVGFLRLAKFGVWFGFDDEIPENLKFLLGRESCSDSIFRYMFIPLKLVGRWVWGCLRGFSFTVLARVLRSSLGYED